MYYLKQLIKSKMCYFKQLILCTLFIFLCSCQGSLDISIYNNTKAQIVIFKQGEKIQIPHNTLKNIGELSKNSYLYIFYKGKLLQYKWPLVDHPITQNKYFDLKGVVQCRFDKDLLLHIVPSANNILDKGIPNSHDVIHIQGQRNFVTNTWVSEALTH